MNEIEKNLAKKLYQVFEMLRNSNEFPNSNTSRTLKEKDKDYFIARSREEWKELEGVISGDHSHSGNFAEDFLLESSQVFYWLACTAVVGEKSFSEFEQEFGAELSRLEKLHAENKIPFAKVFEKDLKECEEKGYLQKD